MYLKWGRLIRTTGTYVPLLESVLWIQIHGIWIRIKDFGPIWIRIHGYAVNFERKN